jgi:hypothetical protein
MYRKPLWHHVQHRGRRRRPTAAGTQKGRGQVPGCPKANPAPTPSPRGLYVGGDLLSHTLPSAVPSALEGLASGFGKGPGVPHSANTTDTTIQLFTCHHLCHTLHVSHDPPATGPGPAKPRGRAGGGCVLRVTQWMRIPRRTPTATTGRVSCGQALGLLVPVNSTCHHASIPGLSTPSSLGGLTHAPPLHQGRVGVVGDLISKRASRLDAFSGYPFRT